MSDLEIQTSGQEAESGPRSRCPGRGRDLTPGSWLPAVGVCSKDPQVQAERGVQLGAEVWASVCWGAEFPDVVTPGVQGGGLRELHEHSLGVEPGAGHTENREGSGEPQKLSVILPGEEGAELLSVLRCPLPRSWAFPGFSGILWASIHL